MMVPQQQRRRRRRTALPRSAERRVIVARGVGGFGFTIAGQRPCVVSAVAAGGPAERAGLRAGDALLAVDGASVARAPHASVARLVAAAPAAIALSVALREAPPTDTEDTEPEERARTRRRHPPPRRRPQPLLHHPACHAAPSGSGVHEILQSLSLAQLPGPSARLECRAVVGYLGTIETPEAAASAAAGSVRNAVRKLRQERRAATPVLLAVRPHALLLRRAAAAPLAHYTRDRVLYAGSGSDADARYFGLVTAAELADSPSHSTHVFAVDRRMADHAAHVARARDFRIACTRDPVAERCLEFPPSADYVVGVIRGMFSLPPDDGPPPPISELALKGDSPAPGRFARGERTACRAPRRPGRREDARELAAGSPQPSNHSEVTTTSSNSDSGIGFRNDCRNVADRILVVEFGGRQAAAARRPGGLAGGADGFALSNTTPVVEGFAGRGRALSADEAAAPERDLPARAATYNYNLYGNMPAAATYDRVYTDNDHDHDRDHDHYDFMPSLSNHQIDEELEPNRVAESLPSMEMYEEGRQRWRSAESVGVPGGGRAASVDSLDDTLAGRGDRPPRRDDHNFLHPASVKCKVRKSKHLNILARTKQMLTGRGDKEARRRALSAGAGDAAAPRALPAAASEPDLRATQSEHSSPFRRWTTSTGSGGGNSYREEHLNINNKDPQDVHKVYYPEGDPYAPTRHPMTSPSEPPAEVHQRSDGAGASRGSVSSWALGLEKLLDDEYGAMAFYAFLKKEFSQENLRFYWSCKAYEQTKDAAARAQLAQEIWERHLSEHSPDAVNVDAEARAAVGRRMRDDPLPPDLFAATQMHTFNVMKFDSYPRFLRSETHAECARAELQGLPPPYAPAARASAPSPSGSKLVKSSSSASERRRRGSGLLSWRRAPEPYCPEWDAPRVGTSYFDVYAEALRTPPCLREPSLYADRPEPWPRHPMPPIATLTHDVLTSSRRSASLCRFVLPDGATSVVPVAPAQPVHQIVDRLLQRRQLVCPHYDLRLKHGNQVIDIELSSSSSELGGREVLVEERCVLRLDVLGRFVQVRCRAGRPLGQVMRHVVARYESRLSDLEHVGASRQHTLVSPDIEVKLVMRARLVLLGLDEQCCPEYCLRHYSSSRRGSPQSSDCLDYDSDQAATEPAVRAPERVDPFYELSHGSSMSSCMFGLSQGPSSHSEENPALRSGNYGARSSANSSATNIASPGARTPPGVGTAGGAASPCASSSGLVTSSVSINVSADASDGTTARGDATDPTLSDCSYSNRATAGNSSTDTSNNGISASVSSGSVFPSTTTSSSSGFAGSDYMAPAPPASPATPAAPAAPAAPAPAASARVRAVVHPGPPLHHHPEFVENLRAAQRSRLAVHSEPPSPLNRHPPPLPPKPRREPTLV